MKLKHVNLSRKTESYHRCISSIIKSKFKKGAKVLDYGCGAGNLTRELSKIKNISITIADIDSDCLEVTKQSVGERTVDTILLSTEPWLNIHNKFDVIVLSHVLEHLLDPINTLQQLSKHLVPGGILIVAVPNPARPDVLVKHILRKNYVNEGHVYSWDRPHFMNFIERFCGFDNVEYYQDAVSVFWKLKAIYPIRPILMKIEELLATIFPWLSFSHIAVIKV